MSLLVFAGCGGGSSPPPAPTPTPPTVTGVSVTGAAGAPTVGDTAQLTATAAFSDGSSQSVTSQAAWESSNPAVATVSASGLATFLAAGDSDLKATFRGTTGTSRVTVATKAPPRFQLSGRITESGTTKLVTGATVTIVDGPDAGRSAVTDAGGMYMLTAITTGSFSLRATRSDFETQTVPVSLTKDSSVDFALKLVTNVSGFFGTYNTTLSIAQQSCEFPFTVGPSGTVNLNGRTDGSGLTVTIVERGTTRTYAGTLRGDGSFSGNGGGVIAGITTGQRNHEYTGDVTGNVSGRNINVAENVLFSIPCPGKTMKILYSGSR
jgi:hypothetical protein